MREPGPPGVVVPLLATPTPEGGSPAGIAWWSCSRGGAGGESHLELGNDGDGNVAGPSLGEKGFANRGLRQPGQIDLSTSQAAGLTAMRRPSPDHRSGPAWRRRSPGGMSRLRGGSREGQIFDDTLAAGTA